MCIRNYRESTSMPYDRRDEDSGKFSPSFTSDEFISALNELAEGASTQEVADEVGCAYRTAYQYLTELEDEGEVTSREVGNAKLWQLGE